MLGFWKRNQDLSLFLKIKSRPTQDFGFGLNSFNVCTLEKFQYIVVASAFDVRLFSCNVKFVYYVRFVSGQDLRLDH